MVYCLSSRLRDLATCMHRAQLQRIHASKMKLKLALAQALFFFTATTGLSETSTNFEDAPAPPSRTSQPTDDPQGRAMGAIRILGGTPVKRGEVPYIVQMKGTQDMRHFCGGTLISPRCVLTAAHCLLNPAIAPHQIKYSVGVLKLTDVKPSGHPHVQSQQVEATEGISHEKFDENTAENDIAVVVLPQPFNTSGTGIKPAFLGSKELIDRKVIGRRARVTGWGKIKQESLGPNLELLYVKQRLWTHEKCAKTVPTLRDPNCDKEPKTECNLKYFPGHICAGGIEDQDSCQGDSGGPLVVQDVNGNFHIVGVVSMGSGCGVQGHPGIYSSVGYYEEWIRSKCPDLPAPIRSRSHGAKNNDEVILKDD